MMTLKAARINAGLTQVDAAKKLGISHSTLRKYEQGVSFPSVPIIKRIEDAYHIEYKDIFFKSHL